MVVAVGPPANEEAPCSFFDSRGKRDSYGDLRSRQRYKDGNKNLVGISQFVNK